MADFYPYHTYSDGTKTSICLRCYRTIGAGGKDLSQSESDHVCQPFEFPKAKNVIAIRPTNPRLRLPKPKIQA